MKFSINLYIFGVIRDVGHPAYATFGTDNLFEPAIRMTHNDGNPSLELKYVTHNIEKPDAEFHW